MNTYIVTFEIKDSIRLNKIKKFLREDSNGICPIHSNATAIRSEKKASEIRDEIIQMTTAEDRIFIIRSGTEAAWKNSYGTKNNDWLKKHL
ncbi:hypothetical protein [Lacinutrix sp. Hel_I_90]|uniref:hypothetical protein n=1 Tax=Lacinutrix sp. Hel_I_90 TaxID=1249999 RepID=UPI0005C85E2F|nr:hypothetical protein [Lacinutrix sp. Hel_I_90]